MAQHSVHSNRTDSHPPSTVWSCRRARAWAKARSGLAVHAAAQGAPSSLRKPDRQRRSGVSLDVGVEPAAVDEFPDDPRPGHLLRMQARLAEFDAQTLDIPDPKAPADQLVEPYAPHDHLTARLSAGQADVLQRFGLDKRQRLAGLGALPAEVPVTRESLARECADRLGGHDRLARADVDRLDAHDPIMAASAADAKPGFGGELQTPGDTEAIEPT